MGVSIHLALLLLTAGSTESSLGASELCLVPFPKEVVRTPASMPIPRPAKIVVAHEEVVLQVAALLQADLKTCVGVDSQVVPGPEDAKVWSLRFSADAEPGRSPDEDDNDLPTQPEGYSLNVDETAATVSARTRAGLLCGIQVLRQLVRCNVEDGRLPGLKVRDWPSLRYRGFSDDITRGPSPRLDTLEREVAMAALLRLNFFTYYLEHQYEFAKHPLIGPKDGSLRPTELKALVEYARGLGVEIIGNQQSFGHFYHILRHEPYRKLRETENVLNPTDEATYKLLDDLYSEQAPLLESNLFNVCCDETEGLGTGPAKALAGEIGVGAVYARHLRRIHDLLRDKYGKRMMMWGDIILMHPDKLGMIPKDTIMLSWGYHAAPSFEGAILPFAKSGYEFFVCPGISNWNRILPDTRTATANIQVYVRDGAKHGALGMLNTTWDDEGEQLGGWNWHGIAWGAECAWNASMTAPEDFNRRIGAVLFGIRSDRFAKAVDLIGRTHSLPGYDAMFIQRFWRPDLGECPSDEQAARRQAAGLRAIVDPALEHVRGALAEARWNQDWLKCYQFGLERMQAMAARATGFLDAGRAYEKATMTADRTEASKLVDRAIAELRRIVDDHRRLRAEYAELWNGENRPFALEPVLARYDEMIGRYAKPLAGAEEARKSLDNGRALPSPAQIGLAITELGVRRTRPVRILDKPLRPDAAWRLEGYPQRMEITVVNGKAMRRDVPIEVALPTSVDPNKAAKLCAVDAGGDQTPVASQFVRSNGETRLMFLIKAEIPAGGRSEFLLYHGGSAPADANPAPDAVRAVGEKSGAVLIENDRFRLLVGPEGSHIYRWQVKSLEGRDLTQPGDTDWAGFADLGGGQRNLPCRIAVEAAGPVVARLRCTDPNDVEKTITAYAGMPWIEVTVSVATNWFWCYDDESLFAPTGKTPGQTVFSNGFTAKVKPSGPGPDCQFPQADVHWSAKFAPGGALLALITPEVVARHVTGPGGGMGGVGVEGSRPVSHFVIYGDRCPADVPATLNSIRQALDWRDQPTIELHSSQGRPE